jgi:ribonuclease VapC
VILDSSALIAILAKESGWEKLASALNLADSVFLSAPTYLETSIVIGGRKDPVMNRELDSLLEQFDVTIEPFTAEHAQIARQAYRDFGKGSGHPANLNFGDCFAYALARAKRQPLLYKGDDFVHTDLRPAIPQS